MLIRPDEWTEVYRYWYKGSTAYYFRNDNGNAYFVSAEGLIISIRIWGLFSERIQRAFEEGRDWEGVVVN